MGISWLFLHFKKKYLLIFNLPLCVFHTNSISFFSLEEMGISYDSLNKVGLGKNKLGDYSSSNWILGIFEFICEG
jgi:hypothetical protein